MFNPLYAASLALNYVNYLLNWIDWFLVDFPLITVNECWYIDWTSMKRVWPQYNYHYKTKQDFAWFILRLVETQVWNFDLMDISNWLYVD